MDYLCKQVAQMTTKEKIKQLLCSYRKLCFVLGFFANQKDCNSDVFTELADAREDIDKVIDALCNELSDNIADLGKKGAALPDGTPINLCGGDK